MNISRHIKNIIADPKSYFLQNIGLKQTIAKNIFWLAMAEGVVRFSKLFLIIYVARILGAEGYGEFSFALSFVGLFVIFADCGLSQIITREFAGAEEKKEDFFSLFSLKILLSLGALILIVGGSFFITSDPIIRGVIWILGAYIVLNSFSGIVSAFFQARQQMEYQAFASVLQAIIVTIAGFFVLFNFPSVQNLSYAYLFASFALLVGILIFFHFKIFPLKISWQISVWRKFLTVSWPLALAGAFGGIYSQTDSVMMGYWGQITQTGWYNAAYKIIGITTVPVALISQSFFPALSVAFKESKEKLQGIWNYLTESMIFLAVPTVAGGIVLAPRIINWIYDPTFTPSVLAFQILIVTTGVTVFYTAFLQVLIVSDQQKKIFWAVLFGAIANVILNLVLIPKFSLYGAAFTTLITQILIFFLFFKFTIESTSIRPLNLKFFSCLLSACLASIPMCFAIIQPQIYNLNVLFSVLIGAIIYTIVFFIFYRFLKFLQT
ncbi:MAG: oligosaccharide flippase family protein [bacterium]